MIDEGVYVIEQLIEHRLVLERLGESADRAVSHCAMVYFLGRNNADGNVPEGDIILEAIQHAPAVDVGQANIKRDRVRLVFARHRQRGGTQ